MRGPRRLWILTGKVQGLRIRKKARKLNTTVVFISSLLISSMISISDYIKLYYFSNTFI
jgi:hypothetical protein